MPSPSGGLPPLIRALLSPACFGAPVELIETHISWVLLAGDFAYKIKKPVNLGFLDFSSLEKRRFYCAEELRLNQRLAPGVYLESVPIGGSPECPLLGAAAPFEYALKMRRFPQEARLDALLKSGGLLPAHIDRLAACVADFHLALPPAGPASSYGSPEQAMQPMRENFAQIRPLLADSADLARLQALSAWTEAEYAARKDALARRKAQGFVRECHGDLHLANIVLLDGAPTPFDCIEFNEHLRWIDVASDIAFTVMDLADRGQPGLGWRLLNGWLERTGDVAALEVLRLYQVYRAMVRAKVAAIRAAQAGTGLEEYRGYIALAEVLARPGKAALMITRGVSGSGKSFFSQALLEELGAIRLRSDVERKRLFGLQASEQSGSAQDGGIYAPEASARTYARLAELAESVLRAGYPVIVDATFLKRAQRQPFQALAARLGVPYLVLDFQAAPEILRQRIAARAAAGGDASEATVAVMEAQLAAAEELSDEERRVALTVDSTSATAGELVEKITHESLRA